VVAITTVIWVMVVVVVSSKLVVVVVVASSKLVVGRLGGRCCHCHCRLGGRGDRIGETQCWWWCPTLVNGCHGCHLGDGGDCVVVDAGGGGV